MRPFCLTSPFGREMLTFLVTILVVMSAMCCMEMDSESMAQTDAGDTTADGQTSPDLSQTMGHEQIEITEQSTSFFVETSTATDLRFGVFAVDRLVEPSINGTMVARELIPGSSLTFGTDGTAVFEYADPFFQRYRFREPNWGDEERYGEQLDVSSTEGGPRVLEALFRNEAEFMVMTTENNMWWTGQIEYRFDLGHPITALSLSSSDGTEPTRVGSNVTILASRDGQDWHEVSRASTEMLDQVTASIPTEALGGEAVHLRFEAVEGHITELQVSATLDISELDWVTSYPAGQTQIRYQDDDDSDHNAVVFWSGEGVISATGVNDLITYPEGAPQIDQTASAVTIRFPDEVGITMGLEDGGICGIQELTVGQQRILADLGQGCLANASVAVAPEANVGVDDWPAYLLQRLENEMRWVSTGDRRLRQIPLEEFQYVGATVNGNSVVLTTTRDDATLEWVLTPSSQRVGADDVTGLGYQVRATGLDGVVELNLTEPVYMRHSDFAFAQMWGFWIESVSDFVQPFEVYQTWSAADVQPFYHSAGPGGTRFGYYDRPLGNRVSIHEDSARHWVNLSVPFGISDATRSTPTRFWMASSSPRVDKWAAVDSWTTVYEHVAEVYRTALELDVSEPLPALWFHPTEEHMLDAQENGALEYEDSWLAYRVETLLDEAVELGFGVIMIDAPWDADANHHPDEYLPGSDCFGSGAAPWRLEVSEAIGGEDGLRTAVEAIHNAGLLAVIWSSPGHFSNSSDLLVENPDWVRWRYDGMPEDAAYGDIMGLGLRSGYFDYALEQFQSVYDATAIDGIMIDSFLTFGVYPDALDPQPISQFEQTLRLQREWRDMGMTHIITEGCGPLGLSGGAYSGAGIFMDHPDAERMATERSNNVFNREYGLYRYGADMIYQDDSYYRLVASKGYFMVDDTIVIDSMTDTQRAAFAQSNQDYVTVLDLLEERHLIGSGDQWLGVRWTQSDSDDEVIFSFSPFLHSLSEPAEVEDVTAGTTTTVDSVLNTQARHTYIIRSQE